MELAVALLTCLSCLIGGPQEDIRDQVRGAGDQEVVGKVIDPDQHIFGIAYDATEDEVIKELGKPDGYVRLNGKTTVMIYGKHVGFIFTVGKMSGARISSSSIIDWQLANEMGFNHRFDGNDWRLLNGIEYESTLPEVKAILGDELITDGFRRQYETETAVVTFNFATYSREGNDDSAKKLTGIFVQKK